MGFFSKLFKGPEIDMEKSRKNAEKMRLLFNQEVENGDTYRLIFGYTEDVSRFNYGFVHGSRTKIGNLIVDNLHVKNGAITQMVGSSGDPSAAIASTRPSGPSSPTPQPYVAPPPSWRAEVSSAGTARRPPRRAGTP